MRTIALSETTNSVVDNRGKTAPTADSGIALVATNCVSNSDLYPVHKNVRYVSQETYDSWFRAHPEPGDILLTLKGSQNGAVCLAPDPIDFCIAQDMVALRVDEDVIDRLYLFAALRSPEIQWQIKNLDVSGVIPHLKKSDFDKLLIPYPDRARQEMIGRTYFELSAKIELNRRMSETLEAMARALFRSWFVDFDPVRAKIDGRWRRGESLSGLPAHLFDLFPDRLVPSEIGEVPEGWEVRPIEDLADIAGGTTPSTKRPEFWEGGKYAWATPKDLSGLSIPVLSETARRITDLGLSQIGSGLLPPGTVLMSSRAPIGYLAVAETPVAINQGFIAMKPKTGISNLFLLFWTRSAQSEIVNRANGSTFLEISKARFRPIPVVTPPVATMGMFDHYVRALYDRIVVNAREVHSIAGLRDSILPKLLSGEIGMTGASR